MESEGAAAAPAPAPALAPAPAPAPAPAAPASSGTPPGEPASAEASGGAAAKKVKTEAGQDTSTAPSSDAPAKKKVGRPKGSKNKKKPGPKKSGAKKEKKKPAKPGSKKKAAGSKKPGPKKGGAASGGKAEANEHSTGKMIFIKEHLKAISEADNNIIANGGGGSRVLDDVWADLAPDQRAGYEKQGLDLESARLGRELYIAEQKPSILKLGKAAIDEGGGMAHIQDQMWEQLPADGKQGYIAAARRKQHGEAAFKLFEAELQPSISEASEDHSLMGSGGERVKRAMWEELSPAQQDGYVDIAAKKAREQSIAAARASPGKKKRKPRASGSPKSASVAKQYTRAIYEAITSLKDRNGSTVQGIAGWLKSKPSKLDNEVQIKKALKSGVRAKKFEKQKGGVRYKVTKEFRKEILDEQKKEREKEREAEKKIKDEQRKQQLAQQKADRAKLLEQQQQLKDARKKIDAAERERKTALKLNKYPVDDLQALAEVALCDSENMMFYPVAEKHREEVKNLDERRNELFRDAHEANKEKYAEGTRVKMFLQDDEGEEWYYGNVVAVSDKGLDIFFDDDDFQMDVQFDDTDLHLVVAEETEHEEKNTLVDFPTTITDGGAVSARMRAECMAVSSMLMRFSKDVTLPDLSGEEVVDIVSQVSEPGDGASDEEHRAFKVLKEQRNAVHVQLLHVIGTEHMFAEDFIYTEVSEEMIDAYSWPEVLQRFILSNLEDDLQCNAEIRKAASDLAARSYDNITLEQRVCLLSYLCSEALQSPDIRDVIEEDMEATDKLVKEFDESEKALKDKQREQLRKERAEEREKLAEKKKETEGARLAAKQEREAKTAADRAEFKQWLVDRKKPPLEDPKDAKWKTEWKNWKTWKTQEKKRAENEAKAKARKEEQERVRAEKKAAKEAEKIAKAEARAEAKAAKEKAKAEAKEAKKLAKQSKGKNKIMGLDVGEVTAPEQSLAALHGMSRGEYMKHLREQREQALAAEREKRELEELEKQEKIRLEKEAEKEKDARRARGMKKFKQLQAQGRAKQSKEEYQREKEERRVRKKQEKLTSDLEAHACSLTPLGRDRFLNRYWWTPAYPGRLYVEKMKVPLEFLPPLTRAVHACAGSEEERRKAATEAVTQQINSLPEETVRKQLQALQLSIEDEADVRELAIELMQKDLKGREPCLVEFANTGKVVLPPKRVTRPPSRPKKPKPADGSAASGDAAAALPTDAAAAAVDSEQASPREEGSEEKQAEEQAAAATDAEQASPRESEGGQSAADVEMAVEDDEEEEDEDWDGEVDTNYWGLNRTEEDWGYYDTPEQLDALMSNINVLGRREKELNANIVRYEERISEGMMTNRARGRGRRGGGGQKKKAVDTITMLKGELPNLVRKFIPKTEKLRTDGKWEKSVDQCGLWMDIVEPLSELGTALGELGIAADAKASEKAALVGRQWTEQEDKELTELVLEEGPGDWEDKKERMESKRSAAAIKMRWENTLEAKAAEDAKKKKEAGEAFALHQVVWAKIKHFPWWPAYISNNPKTGEALNPKNKKFHVTFFPDNSTGQCLAEDLQPFEAALDEHTSTKIGNKKRAKEREEAVKQAKKYMKDHSDAQKADAPAVKAASPKARPAPKEDGKDDGAAQDKDKEKEKEEDSDDESDSEEEEEEYPATWQQWIPKWQQVVASCNNEVRLTFAFYALRERTEQTIPPLKAPPASASKKRGGKGRAAARKSPGRKGRRRSDHVNYNEDSDDDSEEEEEENKKLGPDDMHDAVADNDRTTLRKVLSSGVDVNALDEDDRTALMNAAESGSKACLRLLLTNDSTDIDATDPDGWTALMFAAKADDDETIRQMCQQAEANTEIKDTSYGMTAFLLACENGCADAVRALAECGCNQQAKDADGSDGRKLAENEDPPHEDVLAVLDDLAEERSSPRAGGSKRGRSAAAATKSNKRTKGAEARKPAADASDEESESESEEEQQSRPRRGTRQSATQKRKAAEIEEEEAESSEESEDESEEGEDGGDDEEEPEAESSEEEDDEEDEGDEEEEGDDEGDESASMDESD